MLLAGAAAYALLGSNQKLVDDAPWEAGLDEPPPAPEELGGALPPEPEDVGGVPLLGAVPPLGLVPPPPDPPPLPEPGSVRAAIFR